MASNGLMVQPSTILPMDNEFEKMLRMAVEFAQSGILAKGIPPKAAAVLLVVQQGYELGIPPAAALANISIVEGKPTLDAKMHRALIYRHHGDDAFRFVETSAARCVIEYKRRGWSEPSRFTLTIDEIPEGLRRKDNWRNYPANMLRARATTFVSVMAFSDTTNGLYTPEELGAEVEIGADGEPTMIARTVNINADGAIDVEPQRPSARSAPPPSSYEEEPPPYEEEPPARPRTAPAKAAPAGPLTVTDQDGAVLDIPAVSRQHGITKLAQVNGYLVEHGFQGGGKQAIADEMENTYGVRISGNVADAYPSALYDIAYALIHDDQE